MAQSEPNKVLYIMGRGRSGSTIFANVLGEYPGFFSAGEVRTLWDPILRDGGVCACGKSAEDCEVWSKVIAKLDHLDVEQVADWQGEVVRERSLTKLLRYTSGGGWPALEGYIAAMRDVYAAITEVTGARVIVDSSKRPSYAAVVRLIQGIESYFVHMVRDPRASAHSWRARKHVGVSGEQVTQRGAIDATVRWDLLNVGAEALMRRVPSDRRLWLKYEDFAAEPRRVVSSVVRFANEEPETSPFKDERTVELGTNHAIAGNPSRQKIGDVELRDSRDWEQEQSRADRVLATAVALPLLRRYGYPVR